LKTEIPGLWKSGIVAYYRLSNMDTRTLSG